jgi:hypothetical protein
MPPGLRFMTQFPVVDPLPLPAPVWLFKVLHDLSLALHLASVDLLLGGLILALAFAVAGKSQPAGMIMRRLPALMAFVVALGLLPLLFAQILYGHALYTSSVLIGTYWIAVIALLAGIYYSVYLSARRADRRQTWAVPGFAALLLVLTIAFIYSNNMTLMLRPQVWPAMSHGSSTGFQLNSSDPTLLARWLFFITGALPVAGAALALLSLRHGLGEDAWRFLARAGGAVTAGGILLQCSFADLAIAAQPQRVFQSVINDPVYGSFAYGWIATAVLLFVAGLMGVIISASRAVGKTIAIAAASIAFLNVGATVMVRDGIRDFSLRAAGFDVWNRQVVANWPMVGVSLFLFVAALIAIGFLLAATVRRVEEKVA